MKSKYISQDCIICNVYFIIVCDMNNGLNYERGGIFVCCICYNYILCLVSA